MRAWTIADTFGIEHLRLVERPDPEPRHGQVVVAVKAVSLNYRDLLVTKGLYNPRMKLPRIPCSDGAGEVIAVGPGVTCVAVGDRVCGIWIHRRSYDGPCRDLTNFSRCLHKNSEKIE